jgi:hypothetical protein
MVKDMYWNMLKDLSDDQFKQASTTIMQMWHPTSTVPFPLVSDLREAAGLSGHSASVHAIQTVKGAIIKAGPYDSVSFNDRALHAVIERFGGWVAICNFSDDDWNINERRLIESYESAVQFGDNGPVHLMGIFEAENTVKGFIKYVPKPKLFNIHKNKPVEIEHDTRNVVSEKSQIAGMIDEISNRHKI